MVIYWEVRFHCAFPSLVRRPDGEIWLAFRRAPNRLALGEEKNYHVDPNRQLVMLRSRDGVARSAQPELIYSDSLGVSQDRTLPARARSLRQRRYTRSGRIGQDIV